MSTSTTTTFTIDRQALSILLSTVSRFAGKATPYDLVDLNFDKGRLFASCFNGEAGIKTIVAAQSNAEDAPKMCFGVNVELLNQLVATMEGNIKIGIQDDKVEVMSGKASSRLNAVLHETLPEIVTGNMQTIATLSGASPLSILRALYFGATDATRPNLNSLLIELDKDTGQIHAWAADGYAASHAMAQTLGIAERSSLLLSNSSHFVSRIASMVTKEDTVQIMVTPDLARVTFGVKEAKARKAMMITAPMMENSFPP
jgi:DNA polymerase III sliding clamp (beta) subunit (PCNA family)